MFVLELRVLPVLRRSPEGSGAPMDFADVLLSYQTSLLFLTHSEFTFTSPILVPNLLLYKPFLSFPSLAF